MRSTLILGLGSFGFTLARGLVDRGNEVVAVDKREDLVNAVKEFVAKSIIADVSLPDALEELGVGEFDTVVVNLGDRIDASVLTTLHLKRLGARQIVVKGISEDHASVLKMVGADQVVFPERDVAMQLAYVLSSTNVLDQIPLAPGYSIVELATPVAFVGKTLQELDLRNRYDIQVIVVKRQVPEEILLPRADFRPKSSDVLVVMGKDENLRWLQDET